MRHNFKTAVCRLFSTGNCAHGSRCMFAHGPGELRSPGMPLNKDEEEMVQRVAAGGKRNKEAAASGPSLSLVSSNAVLSSGGGGGIGGLLPVAAAAASAATPSVAQQVATAQMIALAGHAAASMASLPGLGITSAKSSAASPAAELDSKQKSALHGLSRLGLDPSTLDMMGQLASSIKPGASSANMTKPQLSAGILDLMKRTAGASGDSESKRRRTR